MSGNLGRCWVGPSQPSKNSSGLREGRREAGDRSGGYLSSASYHLTTGFDRTCQLHRLSEVAVPACRVAPPQSPSPFFSLFRPPIRITTCWQPLFHQPLQGTRASESALVDAQLIQRCTTSLFRQAKDIPYCTSRVNLCIESPVFPCSQTSRDAIYYTTTRIRIPVALATIISHTVEASTASCKLAMRLTRP